MIKFSIIIPCYNAEKKIDKCLESLANQTYKNSEIIIVDDNSKDNSYQKILKYSKKYDNVVIIKNEKNLGPGVTRNIGIKHSTGDYILFMDCDDYLDINTLQLLYNTLKSNKDLDLIIFDYSIVYKSIIKSCNSVFNINNKESLSVENALLYSISMPWGKLYKNRIIIDNNIEFPNLIRNEDMPFNKIAISYCNNIYYLKQNLYFYVKHEDSLMSDNSLLDENNTIKAFKHIVKNINFKYIGLLKKIYIKEYIYSITMTMITKKMGKKAIIEQFNEYKNYYPNWFYDKSIQYYPIYMKIIFKCIKHNNIMALKILNFIKLKLK